MCGIGGIVSLTPGQFGTKELTLIKKALIHRGPDGNASFISEHACLVHTRLSIIDLSNAGIQPFYAGDKQEIVSIVNGEIYNYKGLRKELLQDGVHLSSSTDSEIVPHLYLKYGISFVHKIKGMFAIALYNRLKNELFLIRDRFGIKPLYYTFPSNTGTLYFGSELKAVICHEEVSKRPDYQSIHDFLSLGYIPEPATGFDGIHALPPAHYLHYSGGNVELKRFWELEADDQSLKDATEKALMKRVDTVLTRVVNDQMVSDAPIGCFLSGGIDSIQVAAKMAAAIRPKPVATFNVKFPGKQNDESHIAQEVSKHIKSLHTELELHNQPFTLGDLERLILHFDQPFADTSLIPTYLISKRVRSKIKVALSGDGGDEFTAGYPKFWQYEQLVAVQWLPAQIRRGIMYLTPERIEIGRKLRKFIRLSLLPRTEWLFHLSSYMSEAQKSAVYTPSFKANSGNLKPTARFFTEIREKYSDSVRMISDIQIRTSLSSKMLKKVDMMSMLAGIEVRVPLLDENYTQLLYSLPASYKLRKKQGKWLNRKLLSKQFGKHIHQKRKVGFDTPLDQLEQIDFLSYVKEKLLSKSSRVTNLIDSSYIIDLVEAYSGTGRLTYTISRQALFQRLFMLLSLELWMRNNEF